MLKKALRNLQGIVTFTACVINTVIWFAPVFVFAILKLVVPVASFRTMLTRWLMLMGENWVSVNGVIFSLGNSIRWDLNIPDDLSKNGWYLIVANHRNWIDIIALQKAFNRRIPFLKFFIKQELVWFPFLGIAWWAMDMPFMKRYSKTYLAEHPEKKGKDLEATRKACEKFRDTPTSVINFVEGTRFTEEKKEKRRSPFDNLLPPRAGGVALALKSMGNIFDAILDVTIVYPGGDPEFWELMCGELEHVVIDVRRRPAEDWLFEGDYEGDREFRKRFHQWLTGVWEEKDQRIAELQ